jgi:hypothetical protein
LSEPLGFRGFDREPKLQMPKSPASTERSRLTAKRNAKGRTGKEDQNVAVQYLLVKYSDQRTVLADGDKVGITNHTMILPADEYTITLEGSGYSPASQDVVLTATSIMRPMVLVFQ